LPPNKEKIIAEIRRMMKWVPYNTERTEWPN
jgi:hypothetical protein